MIEQIGADAVRFYFYASPVWKSRRFSENLVREYTQKTIGTLWNVLLFFKKNAELDRYHGEIGEIKSDLDLWLLSRLNSTIKTVRNYLDSYDVHLATQSIVQFIDELSNWYVRRSRRRFWHEEITEEKLSGYTAMFIALRTLSLLMAPFTPYLSEIIYREMFGDLESVHLESYPLPDDNLINIKLEEEMNFAIHIAEAGRRARQLANIKLRQPLGKMVISCDAKYVPMIRKFEDVLKEEINVKNIEIGEISGLTNVEVKINYRALGPKLKQNLKNVLKEIQKMNPEEIERKMKSKSLEILGYRFSDDDIAVSRKPVAGVQALTVKDFPVVIYIDTNITYELKMEGLAREIIRRIQTMRKDMNLPYNAKIRTMYMADVELKNAITKYEEYIKSETQSINIEEGNTGEYRRDWIIENGKITLFISKDQ